ncbi:MAG: DUF4400 domain-containing protein [Burkholderiales bacterium]|nr:DUF4400 domain-containing protein [Burkholderiales bacterium]
MKRNWKLTICVMVLTIQVLFGMLLLPNEYLDKILNSEQEYISTEVGQDKAAELQNSAVEMFNKAIVESGVYEKIHEKLTPITPAKNSKQDNGLYEHIRKMGRSSWYYVSKRIEACFKLFYIAVLRLEVFFFCMLTAFPFILVPATWRGIKMRQKARTNFSYSSPIMHKYATSALFTFIFAPIVALLMPFPLMPVVFAVTAVFIGQCTGLYIASIQKRL